MAEGGAEVLVNKLHGLDLTAEESSLLDPVPQEEAVDGLQFAVVAKVLSKRPVSQRMLTTVMGKVWGTSKSMKCNNLGDDLILFNFSNEGDRRYVIQEGPWNFNDRPIVFAAYEGITRPSELDFRHLVMWVRIYDLPLCYMNKKMAEEIGGMFGEVIDTDTNIEGLGWGEYLRICIKMDISKPLRRGVLIKTPTNANGDWFEAKYEKIPHFCFFCGMVGYETCGCEERRRKEEIKRKYSEELRAPSGRRGYRSNTQWEGKKNDKEQAGNFSAEADKEESMNMNRGSPAKETVNTRGDKQHLHGGISSPQAEAEREASVEEGGGIAMTEQTGRTGSGQGIGGAHAPAKYMKDVAVLSENSVGSPAKVRNPKMDVTEGAVREEMGSGMEVAHAMDVDYSSGYGRGSRFRSKGKGALELTESSSKRKRSAISFNIPLAITMGGESEGCNEEGTGPKQRKIKRVPLSSFTQGVEDLSATAAREQPRRSQ